VSKQEDTKFIKTFIGVIIALIVLTVALIVLATRTGSPTESELQARQALDRERAEERLQPVGAVRLSGEPMPEIAQAQPEPAAAAGTQTPEQVVQSVCASCHDTGLLGAPTRGDKAAWEARLTSKGLDTLVSSAINGFGAMPPRGGASISDDEVRETVLFMLREAGLEVE